VRETNALIREKAKKDERIRFLDGAFDLLVDEKGQIREELFVEDRIHMNEEGYRLWTEMLRPYLKERSP
jgi:lysophospholipase L1-like esterase